VEIHFEVDPLLFCVSEIRNRPNFRVILRVGNPESAEFRVMGQNALPANSVLSHNF